MELTTSQIVLEKVLCDFCQASDFEKETSGIDWEFGRQEQFSIVKCKKCGLFQFNPRPIVASIKLAYPGNYGFYQKKNKNFLLPIKDYLKKLLSYFKHPQLMRYPYFKILNISSEYFRCWLCDRKHSVSLWIFRIYK